LAALGILDKLPKFNEIVAAGPDGDVLKVPRIRGLFNG